MKKIVLIFGLIGGVIVTSLMYLTIPKNKEDFGSGEIIGYSTMLIALSSIFFAIKLYRDRDLGGKITFGKGFLLGLYITLVAGVIYAIGWEFYYQNQGQDFMEQYTSYYIEKMKTDGASDAEIMAQLEQIKSMGEMYKNFAFRFAFTIFEILPVGLLISLISAAILRKKEILPAA